MRLSNHPTLSLLRKILPEAGTAGGSFIDSLPEPKGKSMTEMQSIRSNARQKAIRTTVQDLLEDIGTHNTPPLERGPQGNRIWPNGYTGSISYKGTVVLGTLCSRSIIRTVGIDVELDQYGGENLSHVASQDELPIMPSPKLSLLSAFSVKESVYKASYPIEQKPLDFNDVDITWGNTSDGINRGIAQTANRSFDVGCISDGDWVVSTAYLKKNDSVR